MSNVSTETAYVLRLSQKEADIVATALLTLNWDSVNFPEAEELYENLGDAGASSIAVKLDTDIEEFLRDE